MTLTLTLNLNIGKYIFHFAYAKCIDGSYLKQNKVLGGSLYVIFKIKGICVILLRF